MKYLLAFIIFNITLIKINASAVDSTLIKQYQRGYDIVYEIIERENLKDSIANSPFCFLFYENLWSVTVKKEKSYALYYGFRIGNEKVTHKEIPIDNTIMNNLFSLEQYKIEKCVRRKDSYTPIYWYLLLTDSMHNKKFEWNAYSICDDKYYEFFEHIYGEYSGFLFTTVYEDKYGQ